MPNEIEENKLTKEADLGSEGSEAKQTGLYIVLGLLLVVLLTGVVLAIIAMVNNPAQTETIRDIVIILMAIEALAIGLTLIVLIVQLARLTALLQNEIRPILDSTNDTLNTLRGTTQFLSNNLVSPVIKANSTVSAVRQALKLIGGKKSDFEE